MIRWIVKIVLVALMVIGAITVYGMLPVDATTDADSDTDVGGAAEIDVVSGGISIPALVGTAAAQDDDADEDAAPPEHQTAHEFSDSLRIVDWEWEDGVFIAEFEAETQTTVTVYEVPDISDFEGGEPYGEQFTIQPDGTTTVEFAPPDGLGVQIIEGNTPFMDGNPSAGTGGIQGPPAGEEWSPIYIIFGLLFSFGSILASSLLLFNLIDKITGGKKVF
ncbi:hypothetical protein [Natronorubrum sp. DTA28]|uniref:hypothetical protein n=1 Tax=Natronorubrum sp. DTA28 TaxID=3447019 RepID=UPI003F8254F6